MQLLHLGLGRFRRQLRLRTPREHRRQTFYRLLLPFPTIVWWMPCLVASCAVVNSPRSASRATLALNSAEYRFRLPVTQVRPSQQRAELNPLDELRGPPHEEAGESRSDGGVR